MKEGVFLSELGRALRERGAFFYKIKDAPQSYMRGSKVRFEPAKPFDAFGIWQGIPFAIEAKQLKTWKAFGPDQVRESQVSGLNDVQERGGLAFIFLNLRIAADPEKNLKRENRLLIFPWPTLHARFERFGSIKKKELETLPHLVGKSVKTGVVGQDGTPQRRMDYDLKPFFKALVRSKYRPTSGGLSLSPSHESSDEPGLRLPLSEEASSPVELDDQTSPEAPSGPASDR